MRIKKVTQTTPIQAEVVDSLDGNSTTNAPSVRAVNEIKGKILWENTNPQAITTETPITLNSSDYDMYEVLYSYSMDFTKPELMSSGRIKKGNSTRLQFVFNSNNYTALREREIKYNSDTSLTIGKNIGNDDNASTIIPKYIIGYKTGLFD